MEMPDLQKHKFYVILGFILAVYVIFYLIMVRPMYTDRRTGIDRKLQRLSSTKRELQQFRKETIPHSSLIKFHEEQRSNLETAKNNALEFFKNKDQYIEKWFPEITGTNPEFAFFKALYQNKSGELIEESLKNLSFPESFDKSRSVVAQEIIGLKAVNSSPDMKEAQKDFWIAQGILNILQEGNLAKLTFFSRDLDRSRVAEEGKESDLFFKHKVVIVGEIAPSNLPLLIKKVLNNNYFLTRIEELGIDRTDYTPQTVTIEVPWEDKPKAERKEEALDRYLDKNQATQTVPVKVRLVCNVLDYKNYPPIKNQQVQ